MTGPFADTGRSQVVQVMTPADICVRGEVARTD